MPIGKSPIVSFLKKLLQRISSSTGQVSINHLAANQLLFLFAKKTHRVSPCTFSFQSLHKGNPFVVFLRKEQLLSGLNILKFPKYLFISQNIYKIPSKKLSLRFWTTTTSSRKLSFALKTMAISSKKLSLSLSSSTTSYRKLSFLAKRMTTSYKNWSFFELFFIISLTYLLMPKKRIIILLKILIEWKHFSSSSNENKIPLIMKIAKL